MTDAKRRIAITKKVSLADIADGWDDCYAVITLADFQTYKNISSADLDNMNQVQLIELEMQVVRDHFISGKILALDEKNEPQLVDMNADDVAASPAIANKLYLEIMGVSLDPKDLPTTAPDSLNVSADSNNMKTTLSTESPVESTPESSTNTDSSNTENASA